MPEYAVKNDLHQLKSRLTYATTTKAPFNQMIQLFNQNHRIRLKNQ